MASGVAGSLRMNSRCATKSPACFPCVAYMLRMAPQRSPPCSHWEPAGCCGCCGKLLGAGGEPHIWCSVSGADWELPVSTANKTLAELMDPDGWGVVYGEERPTHALHGRPMNGRFIPDSGRLGVDSDLKPPTRFGCFPKRLTRLKI